MNGPIIVGVDGSESAAKAAESSAKLARALNSELIVAFAYGATSSQRVTIEGREFTVDHETTAEGIAESTITALRDDYPDLQMTPLAVEGKPAEALVQAAVDRDAEMIVVGNRRVQGLARVLGSVASDVARKAHCDVHIAHTND